MRIAILTTDNREYNKKYEAPDPCFGAAPTALLEGFAKIGTDLDASLGKDCAEYPEIEVISCSQHPLPTPFRIARNVRHHSVYVPKYGWLRSGYLGCILAVRKKLKELSPDIVHGQGTERDCAISAVFSGRPNVLTIHGNMAEISRRFHGQSLGYHRIMGKLEDFTLPRSSGVFCNSDYTLSLVEPRARKVWRVDNPIRSAFFGKRVTGRSNDVPVILNIGVVSQRKRQVELLDLARRIHRRGIPFELRFIGSCTGEGYPSLFLEKIRDAEREGYASYHPEMEVNRLIQEMDDARAICHFPSEEAFGLVVAEGLARELKFFGSRVGGISGIAEGVLGAELVDPDDLDRLECLLLEWLKSGAPRGHHGIGMIRQKFHPEVVARRHLEIYREVLDQ
jgi:glycosyltransferase involved in cell wall biosynthesis